MISAKIVADSLSPAGVRLTTMEVVFPRFILAEANTHRMLSRNSASSRAIPVQKIIKRILDDPFVPWYWGKNQKGMQAHEWLNDAESEKATTIWLAARDDALGHARALLDLGVHKQTANRLLEPFMWHTAIFTATEWSNFFHLRRHPDAQPEIRDTAEAMWLVMQASVPTQLTDEEWHLPYILEAEMDDMTIADTKLAQISSARCARVSSLTHDTGLIDRVADIGLYTRLSIGGHMSPLEHPAQATTDRDVFYANFRGWMSLRYQTPYEWDILASRN